MNAYELAKALEIESSQMEYGNVVSDWELLDIAAKMLCQQADRIAELEKKGEPVAWMEYIQDEEWEVWYTEPTDLPEGHSYKPLYLAPQTKPLSDEEITEIYYPFLLAKYQFNMASPMFDTLGFVRAIEERHGIK